MTEPQNASGPARDASRPPGGPGSAARYWFKLARTPQEHEQIDRLLYETFVREVPRYEDPGGDRLVDKFHDKNHYIVAIRDTRVCGVIAVHDRPPFSVADALDGSVVLAKLQPRLLEARVLAVERRERFGRVFAGLGWSICEYARRGAYRYIAITGLAARRRMYQRIGFQPLGPALRRGKEYFVPMLLDLSNLPEEVRRTLDRVRRRIGRFE